MANATFRVFDVGEGDCIFLCLNDREDKFTLMIDCGMLTEEVEYFVCHDLNSQIDLLVVTHIDGDHIIGLREMLRKHPEIKIGKILYNCGQKVGVVDTTQLTDSFLQNLNETARIVLKNKRTIIGEFEVSAPQALTLAETILSNTDLVNAWSSQNEYVSDNTHDYSLGEQFGKLIFLSPTTKAIEDLDNEFKKAFFNLFYDVYQGPYSNETTLFEILISALKEPVNDSEKRISSTICTIEGIRKLASEDNKGFISPSNKASISFIWECRGKRVLFSGDADPSIIVTNFLRKSAELTPPEYFEIIKVPHHGSAHNCGERFWEFFDANHIFITGYDEFKRPSKECLAKIVSRPTEEKRNIHYTHENESIRWLASNPDAAEALNFSLTNTTSHEFTY